MLVGARLDWDAVGWGTPLVRAHLRGATWSAARDPRRVERGDADGAFLAAIAATLPPERRAPWERLRSPGARAVVTGQQPGCAGGPLLAFYKAATAVALARTLEAAGRCPVVPVYWNATDDDDFNEIATLAVPARDGTLLFLELAGAGRSAAGWVGDLPASGDAAAVAAAGAAFLPERSAALAPYLPAAAVDHGDWVGTFLGHVFPELAVLDARHPALRIQSAELFGRYLDEREAAIAAVTGEVEAQASRGFAPTLDASAAQQALFLTRARRREKATTDLEPLRAALRHSAADLSPNVVLRPLVQDALLPTVAQVVGPSELGYLYELRGLRRLLEVPEPALVPRLSCTLVEPEGWAAAQALGIAPATLVAEPDHGLRHAARSVRPDATELHAAMTSLNAALAAAPLADAARKRAERRLEAWRSEVENELDAAARNALRDSHPAAAVLPAVLRPRGRMQERLLGGLWPIGAWGARAGDTLVALAAEHCAALEAGRGEHALVVL